LKTETQDHELEHTFVFSVKVYSDKRIVYA